MGFKANFKTRVILANARIQEKGSAKPIWYILAADHLDAGSSPA